VHLAGKIDPPRLTGIQFYESHFYGYCMGFQLVYDGQPQDKDMIYFDEQSTICMTTDIILDVD
jgi:hypothetical protein